MQPMPQPPVDRSPTHAAAPVLPLEEAALAVDAQGGLARVTLTQRFQNPCATPLSVTYKLPLPADAAVSGFAFTVGSRRVEGIVEGRAKARATYEQAMIEGRGAALLEQDRSSLFTQEIANIPPGESVSIEVVLDQPLAWLPEGAWELRFPLAAAPRYLGADQGEDGHVRRGASRVEGDPTFPTALGGTPARATLALRVRDALTSGRSPESPSHAISCVTQGDAFAVGLGGDGRAPLDRDVVVRWPVARPAPGASLDLCAHAAGEGPARLFGLLTVVPPAPSRQPARVARDLVLLLDTSGSMQGTPLSQMQRIACALIDSLGDADTLEVIEFSNQTRAFAPRAEPATRAFRERAARWVMGLRASGGTEMTTGVREAIRALRTDAQRQVVLVTDGLVGFEREVVGVLDAELPATARLHAVGVGESANRSLLAPIARAGRGAEVVVGLSEDPERAVARLLAHTDAPTIVDVTFEGSALRTVAPARPRDLFAGAPLRVALELDPAGGELVVRGRSASGVWAERLTVTPGAARGSVTVAKQFARERVEDLEMAVWLARDAQAIDREIEALGTDFQIATRLTSWVATTREVLVDPRAASRRVEQPHALPFGMSAEGVGLRAAAMPMSLGAVAATTGLGMAPMASMAGGAAMDLGDDEAVAHDALSEGSTRAGVVPRRLVTALLDKAARALGGRAAPPPPPAMPSAPRPIPAKYGAPPPPPARSAPQGFGPPSSSPPGAPPPAFAPPPPPPGSAPPPVAPPAAVRSAPSQEAAKEKKAESSEATRRQDSPPAARARKLARAMRSLAARLLRSSDTRLVVLLDVDAAGLELDLAGAVATLVLPDGSTMALRIVLDESTYEGSYGEGAVVRWVLETPSPLAAGPFHVLLRLPGAGCEIHAS